MHRLFLAMDVPAKYLSFGFLKRAFPKVFMLYL